MSNIVHTQHNFVILNLMNMNEYFESLYTSLLKEYPAVFIHNSIESESLHKACELASSGNADIAYQIVEHLLIPADIQQTIIARMQNSSTSASITNTEEKYEQSIGSEKEARVMEVEAEKVERWESKEKTQSEVFRDRVTEMPVPRPVFAPVPVPPAVDVFAVPAEPVFLDTVTSAPPLPPLITQEEKSEPQTLPSIPSLPPVPSATEKDTHKDTQKEILENILNTQNIAPDVNSHRGRLSQNKNVLEAIIEQKESNKNLDGDVHKVTGSQYDIPGVIKTYAEPALSSAQTAQQEVLLQKKIEKAKSMFLKVEEYLAKAYASDTETLIISAERQYANLKDRYPEYVAHAVDHIQKLDNFKNKKLVQNIEVKKDEEKLEIVSEQIPEIQKQLEPVETPIQNQEQKSEPTPVRESSVNLDEIVLAGMQVRAGMKITGEQDVYKVVRIEKFGAYTRVMFEGEQSHNMFAVPVTDLESALYIEDLHPDTFFAPFLFVS